MEKKDKRIDAYIAKSADFAKPILKHLRQLVHKACPNIEETIKWGFPHFDCNGILCSMAAFKHHCAFGFWKASLMSDPNKILSKVGETAMGQLGKIKELDDLPSEKVLIEYIKEAVKLNSEGIRLVTKSKSGEKRELEIPDYFTKALNKNKEALKIFESFSYTNKKEYVEWVTEAKSEETKNKRLATSMEWIAEGKIKNWKYVKNK